MAKSFETWTVLPHKPLQKLEPNLWTVEGTMPGGKIRRTMTLARRHDGQLVIHNGVALDDKEMAEVEAFGKPGYILVPNGYHRQDAKIFKKRYPQAKLLCPKAAVPRVAEVVPPDGPYDTYPADPDVAITYLDGVKEAEGIVQVQSEGGVSLVFNDAIANISKLGGLMGFAMGPTGQASVPRLVRWMVVKDRKALAAHLLRLASIPRLKRIVVGHGAIIDAQPAEVLKMCAAQLS